VTIDDIIATICALAAIEFVFGFICGVSYRSLFTP